jgi:2-methylisocitrate lyase-like PEP mutase family enzyme
MSTHSNAMPRDLRAMIANSLVVAPGVFDAFSALLVKDAGFDAVYLGGAWVTASAFGRPDVGWMALPELVEVVRRITSACELPLIVDADSGYGGPIGIYRTVRDLAAAGAAAVHIEDIRESQPGGEFYSVAEMQARIHAALDARIDDRPIIVARTDTRAKLGLNEAIDRACMYSDAGAELLFVNWPQSEEEVKRIADTVSRPLLLQITEGGRTPQLSHVRLAELGVRLVVYPGGTLRASAASVQRYLAAVRSEGPRPKMITYEARRVYTNQDFFEEWQATHSP